MTFSPASLQFPPSAAQLGLHFGVRFPPHKRGDSDCVPTPPRLAREMIRQLDIRRGMSVLEPSAGTGNIAGRLRKHSGIDLSVLELDPILAQRLQKLGYRVVGSDFLAHRGRYDRIVMNPPFSQGQCMDHVEKAYRLLKPGGKLAAVVPCYVNKNNSRRSREFISWLQDLPKGSYQFRPVDEQAFLNRETDLVRPLKTYILTIQKPKGSGLRFGQGSAVRLDHLA